MLSLRTARHMLKINQTLRLRATAQGTGTAAPLIPVSVTCKFGIADASASLGSSYSLARPWGADRAVRYVSHLASNRINYAVVKRKPLKAILAYNDIAIARVCGTVGNAAKSAGMSGVPGNREQTAAGSEGRRPY